MALNLCGNTGANTGGILCDKRPGIPKKPFLGAKAFSSSEYIDVDSFKAALLAACKLPTGNSSKLFPLPEIQAVEDKTEANKEGTLAFGFKETLLEGIPAFDFSFVCGTAQFQKLRKFNGSTIPVFIADNQNLVWGKKSGENFVGFDASVFFTGNKLGNAADVVVVKGTINLQSAADYYDYGAYVPFDFNINEAKGLLDVVFSEPAAHSTNVYKIKAEIETAQMGKKLNLYDDYSTTLATETLWEAFTGTNYATALTITSVAGDPTNKGFTVTFDSTAYAALTSGAKIKFNLKSPATLDAANVVGVEGNAIILTK